MTAHQHRQRLHTTATLILWMALYRCISLGYHLIRHDLRADVARVCSVSSARAASLKSGLKAK
eukprot:4429854-Amphidinium_carterae.2